MEMNIYRYSVFVYEDESADILLEVRQFTLKDNAINYADSRLKENTNYRVEIFDEINEEKIY